MSSASYDPASYWGSREHPNTDPNAGIGAFDTKFIGANLTGVESVLEIGPGVGRLFPIYKNIPRIATIDLSRNYADRIEKAAERCNIVVESFYLDNALGRYPFADQEFELGIASHVLMHVPFANIRHSLSEAARCCKRVAVLSVVHPYWPKPGAAYDSNWHCFNHDYEALCKELDLTYSGYQKFAENSDGSSGFGFCFSRKD